jgi:hypothetical protein
MFTDLRAIMKLKGGLIWVVVFLAACSAPSPTPSGQPGHAYAEMAQAFWDEYQSSRNLGSSCGKAVAYATAHPDILIYLGSDYHGTQSLWYQPADICPFK